MISPVLLSQDQSLLTGILHNTLVLNSQLQHIELQAKKSTSSRLKQKPQHPIEVLSDEEEKQIICSQFQEQLFRTKIEEAKLTKSKYNILKVLYVEMNFKNVEEKLKQKKFNSMVKAYIFKNLKTSQGNPYDMRNSYFFDRIMAKPDQEFVTNEYILFGCDLLSQRLIEKMFQSYTPSIKWINSSHCKLTFLQKIKGWEAVINNCRNFEQFRKDLEAGVKVENLMNDLQLQSDHMQEQYETQYNQEYAKLQKFKKEYHLLKYYVELMPYYEMGFKRRLMIRNVTLTEQKIGYNLNLESKSLKSYGQDKAHTQEKKAESDFKKYLRVKQILWKQIENSPLVKPQYEKIEMELQRQQELLKLSKRQKPIHNNRQVYKKYNNQGERYFQRREGSKFDSHSHKSYCQNTYTNPRNRSRDPSERYNHTERGDYQNYGQGYRRYNERKNNHWESMQKHFDNYLEQRQGYKILQNPHQYLEPQFVDGTTGTHFYRNPFYNPNAQSKYQGYSQLNPYQNHQQPGGNYQNYQDLDYRQEQDQNLSGYEYQGNRPFNKGTYNNNLIRKEGFNQRSNFIHGHHPYLQNKNIKSNNHHQSLKSSVIENDFNNYLAQRQAINRSKPQISKTKNVINQMTRNGNNKVVVHDQEKDHLFQADQDFSIITQQKVNEPLYRKDILHEQNLENLLKEIYQEEPQLPQNKAHLSNQQDDSQSEGLQFILEQKQKQKSLKQQVKVQKPVKMISNQVASNQGFIVETIKQENLANWAKCSHNVDEIGNLKQSIQTSQNDKDSSINNNQDVKKGLSFMTGSQSVQNGKKKKILQKKVRSGSQSLKKRAGQSVGKVVQK